MDNRERNGAPDWLAGALLLCMPVIFPAIEMIKDPETAKMFFDGEFLRNVGLATIGAVVVFHNLAGQVRRQSGK